MAIDAGLQIACSDLNRRGGVQTLFLANMDTVTAVTTGSTHDITISAGDLFVYEFEKETAQMTVTTSKENGSTICEVGIEAYLPEISKEKFHELTNMQDACIYGIVKDWNNKYFVIGLDGVFTNTDAVGRTQTYADLTSVEGGTGAAWNDQNGVMFKLTAKQGELPRELTNTVTIGAGSLIATLS
jgi:hypothetical protein